MTEASPPEVPLDRVRYLRVTGFFARAVAQFIWWEIILRALLGSSFVERSETKRWTKVARRFRKLALELGGVLIKLGQFLSVRVDMLPPEVTAELAGLQDEVPPDSFADIQVVIEQEYGQPVDRVFQSLSPQPQAAASLAQVHSARLLTGDEVVVKVQRRHIETVVETDLQAIRTAAGWLKRYGPIRRRADMDRLYEEFSATTRAELDFVAEGENAELFAREFADDPGVRVPRIYAQSSTRRVLIMEDVASIKISDFDQIEAAGISRKEVADRLFDTYLRQVFVLNCVHADPHPGNLFVEPLTPTLGNLLVPVPGDGSGVQGRPFRLVFVDFGMVAAIPERVRTHLRDYLIAFATKDVDRMVRAIQGAGLLLPGANLDRLGQMEADLMDRYSGLTLGEARKVIRDDWQDLAHEYRDILYEMPFQIPSDLLFVGRTMAILFGMATSLDPDFDPWQALQPFATQVATEEVKSDWRSVVGELEKATRVILSLPGQADRFFSQASRGDLGVRTTWAPQDARVVRRVETAVNRLSMAIVFAALLLSAVAVYVTQGGTPVTYILFALAAFAFLLSLTRR